MMPVPKNYGAHHCIVGSALRRAALRLRYYPRRRLKEIAHPAGRSNTKPFNFFVGSSCLPKRPEDPKTNREKGGIRNKKGRKRHTHRQVFFQEYFQNDHRGRRRCILPFSLLSIFISLTGWMANLRCLYSAKEGASVCGLKLLRTLYARPDCSGQIKRRQANFSRMDAVENDMIMIRKRRKRKKNVE